MTTNVRQPAGRDAAGPLYRSSLLIHLAMLAAPTFVAAVAWWAVRAGAVRPMPLPEGQAFFYLWLVGIVGGTLAALKFWSAHVEPLIADVVRGIDLDGSRRAALLPALLRVWVCIAAPALFGAVLYMLTGAPLLLLGSLAYLWLGGMLSRPRAAWYRPASQHADGRG